MEVALCPGTYVDWHNDSDVVDDLEQVKTDIDKLAAADPGRASALYEVFVAACIQKAEEFDDSDGRLGMFVESLFVAWASARRAAKAKPHETVEKLLWWIDHDDYGLASGLEKHVAPVLDKATLALFVDEARHRLANAPAEGKDGWKARYWVEGLRSLLAAQRDVPALVAHCEATGLTGDDCEQIAEILTSRRRPADALAWVERGLALQQGNRWPSSSGWHLADMRRSLLRKLGRGDEAAESAWAEYETHPSEYRYETVMKNVPKAERAAAHARAMAVAESADLSSLMSLLVKTKEIERLAARVRSATDGELEGMSHFTTEPAAKALAPAHPDVAARVFRALGLRVVNAKKSRYYDAALANFEDARDCYARAGLGAQWNKLVDDVRAAHSRKAGFISGFETIAAGMDRRPPPSFLDQAKRRFRPGG